MESKELSVSKLSEAIEKNDYSTVEYLLQHNSQLLDLLLDKDPQIFLRAAWIIFRKLCRSLAKTKQRCPKG